MKFFILATFCIVSVLGDALPEADADPDAWFHYTFSFKPQFYGNSYPKYNNLYSGYQNPFQNQFRNPYGEKIRTSNSFEGERSFIENILNLPKEEDQRIQNQPESQLNLRMKQNIPTMKPFFRNQYGEKLETSNSFEGERSFIENLLNLPKEKGQSTESEMNHRMKQKEQPFAFVYNTALPSANTFDTIPVKYPLDLDELMSEKSLPISNDVDIPLKPKKQKFHFFQKKEQGNPSFLKQKEEKPSFQRLEQEKPRKEQTREENPSVSREETPRIEKFRSFSAVP